MSEKELIAFYKEQIDWYKRQLEWSDRHLLFLGRELKKRENTTWIHISGNVSKNIEIDKYQKEYKKYEKLLSEMNTIRVNI